MRLTHPLSLSTKVASSIAMLWVAPSAFAAQPMQTYVIDSFGGESLVSVIRPILAKGGSISSYQDRLIIRTTPANYAEVQQLLLQVDTTPRQLKLSLRVQENSSYQNRGVDVGDVVITRNRGGKWGVGADVDVDYQNGTRSASSTYSVNALSGYQANIDSGTLLSLTRSYIGRYGAVSNISLVPVTQGMSIVPRQLPDGRVQLDVAQRYDRVSMTGDYSTRINIHHRTVHQHGTHAKQRHDSLRQVTPDMPDVKTQSSHTQVIVQPNQWVSIGNIVQYDNQSRTLGKSSRYINIPIEVKVEPLQ